MIQRLHIVIRGAVQGVGFRPFIYRLATSMNLPGWVTNSPQGVFVEVEGEKHFLDTFLLRIEKEKPPRASIQSLECSLLDPVGLKTFEIRPSEHRGELTALVLPDIAVCPDCLQEIFDPANRRYLYPFTNCTNCGPRFTILESLPYDRAHTSMKAFQMCGECQSEYENPIDRRFHAQPNACPRCGPHIELWDEPGTIIAHHHEALLKTADALQAGKIVALKGLGGFHLLVDARNEKAVCRLRERKRRDEKPLALMFPLLNQVKSECEVSDLEERLLASPESPIVLLRRRSGVRNPESEISAWVAPHNPYLGVMLPYTPLHHLLMRELGFPVVATSGNLSDEPICLDEHEARARLRGIADLFLVHNRPIVRHVDDSVARIIMGRELVLRRARGYAPLPIAVRTEYTGPLLAVGAHLKNTVAISAGNGNIFVSQHIGDLETQESFDAFKSTVADLSRIYQTPTQDIACDLHPDYLSTRYAQENGTRVTSIQHHFAHMASCMAENELEGKVLGVSWDGTGYGPDDSIWGGEFLLPNENGFQRIASFRKFRLPGSSTAIKEPRRTAIGVLFEVFGESVFQQNDLPPLKSFNEKEISLLQQMLVKGVNSPWTSSAGRLFDAVASIIGVRQKVRFEGQAAMELEFSIGDQHTEEAYPFEIQDLSPASNKTSFDRSLSAAVIPDSTTRHFQSQFQVDWKPTIEAILRDLGHSAVGLIAAKFHNMLAECIVEVAKRSGQERVALSGGCFQNKYLTERTVTRLKTGGFRPYWHQRIPPNDGGIALGQIVAACRLIRKEN